VSPRLVREVYGNSRKFTQSPWEAKQDNGEQAIFEIEETLKQ
jgi:hypothetical protein